MPEDSNARPDVQPDALTLDGRSLSLADVADVAGGGRTIGLSDAAAVRVERSRALRDRLLAERIPIYGVTTGYGDSAHRQISPDRAAALQPNLLRFLGAGTGRLADPEVVRATMLLRANTLAKGNSGVRVALVEQILALLRVDALPRIPERGSCGASGDLIPLSYLGRALVGEADVLYRGAVRPAADVLREHGREPLVLEPKEGLAITNGTSFTSAFACLAVAAARNLTDVADVATALTSEAVLGNRGHFNAFLFDHAKPHPGSVRSAANVRRLLGDSELVMDSEQELASPLGGAQFLELSRPIQDRYSIRCAPHVLGVLRDVADGADAWLSIEINASDDNPLFDVEGGRVQSGGNFYAGHPGQAMDALKLALANLCDVVDRQLELLVDEKFSAGLPPNLIAPVAPSSPQAGLHHGFKAMQLCSSAMTAEALKTAAPATVHSRSTECHNQDKVSMATIAARDARTIAGLAAEVLAIHLIAACQALEIRGLPRASSAARAVHATVRRHVSFVDVDRPLDRDIAAVVRLIDDGEIVTAAGL